MSSSTQFRDTDSPKSSTIYADRARQIVQGRIVSRPPDINRTGEYSPRDIRKLLAENDDRVRPADD